MKNNFNKSKGLLNPANIAVKFASKVLQSGFLFSIIIIIFSIYKVYNPPEPVDQRFYYYCILFSLLSATLFILALKQNDSVKVNLSLLIVSTVISIYGFEIYLDYPKIFSDSRTKIEVLNDFKNNNIEAYPDVYPYLLTDTNGINTSKGKIYPLGAISNTTIVYCNETDYWSIFTSDEHGFNNSKGLYQINKVDIVLTGDSFTNGACVKPNENIGALLRKSGFHSISLGKSGNGPLLEFAALKEYAKPLEPKIVLWVYYRNDIRELAKELSSSFLSQYLYDTNFSQNLISKQREIDAVLKNYIRKKWELLPFERKKGDFFLGQ